jgi:hypothetical protein
MRQFDKCLGQARGRPVHVALFGFSRGAALARAFAILIANRCVRGSDGAWRLSHNNTRHQVRIYFMGLFDTVASVGSPMSNNNEPARGRAIGALSLRQAMRNRSAYGNALANIALGEAPGADPASGLSNGHMSWADDLRIPAMVEDCLHMVATHEIRNSFPVDSLLQGPNYPPRCREMAYPGAHSDVGGGYRRGEGGRSDTPGSLLSMIPLRAMRREAIQAGVPLMARPPTEALKQDFAEDAASEPAFQTLSRRFNHFMNVAGWGGKSLGEMVLAHTRLFHQWRFHKIFRKLAARQEGRDTPDQAVIRRFEPAWALESDELTRRTNSLERQSQTHQRNADALRSSAAFLFFADVQKKHAEESRLAAQTHDAYLSEKARLDTMPSSDGSFLANSDVFDEQLLADAKELQALAREKGRNNLRPHYRALLEAYEAEFNNRGLNDKEIIAFFDTYVHDSLAGFGKDATLPSDPRVIYIGGDRKSQYAINIKLPAGQGGPASALG